AQFHAQRFRSMNKGGNDASALGISSFPVEKAIRVTLRVPRRETRLQLIRIDPFDPMAPSPEQFEAFIFEIARLHRMPAHKKKSDLVIQLDAEFSIPSLPDLARALSEFRIIFVCAIGCPDCLTNIGGSGEGMWQRPGINQHDFVSAFSQ